MYVHPFIFLFVCIYMHVYNSHTSQTLDIEVFQYDTEFRDEKSYSEIIMKKNDSPDCVTVNSEAANAAIYDLNFVVCYNT